MNRYFSRLAERSGVAVNANSAGSSNASSRTAAEWGEQAVETAAPAYASVSASGNEGGESENTPTLASDLGRTISAELPNFVIPSFDSAAGTRKNEQNFMATESSAASGNPSTQSHFTEQGHTTEIASAKPQVSGDPLQKQTILQERKKSISELPEQYRSHSETRESHPDAPVALRRTSSAASPEAAMKARARTESMHDQANARAVTHEKQDSATTEVARANAVTSHATPGRSRESERVASSPLQTTDLPVQSPRPSPRSSIEVNIGKIELEIFAPANKPVAPPAPAPSRAPRQKPAAAFSPHRHYLRGR